MINEKELDQITLLFKQYIQCIFEIKLYESCYVMFSQVEDKRRFCSLLEKELSQGLLKLMKEFPEFKNFITSKVLAPADLKDMNVNSDLMKNVMQLLTKLEKSYSNVDISLSNKNNK